MMNHRDAKILEQATNGHAKANIKRLWEMTYAHGRRKHRHTCQRCRKIVNDGEEVVMWRFGATKTRVLHAACADVPMGLSEDGYTFREWALTHAYSHLIT